MSKAKQGAGGLTIDLGKAQAELASATKGYAQAAKALLRAEESAEAAAKQLGLARETLARGAKAVLG